MEVAKDIMEKQVVRVGANQPVMDVCRLFYEEEISGAPVVDDADQVVGVVSLTDLIRTAQSEHDDLTGGSTFYRQMVAPPPSWFGEVGEFENRLAGTLVSEVMTEEVVAVSPDTPISLVVKKILDHHIHRVLVLDETREYDHLAGIISVFDLVKLLE
jgi:CBS domain-containing protein